MDHFVRDHSSASAGVVGGLVEMSVFWIRTVGSFSGDGCSVVVVAVVVVVSDSL